jgi:glycine cleavage system transcriptional repressor
VAELVICAVGPDRPGLVDELTGYLLKEQGNIADSRMVNLRGQFALVMLVDVPAERAAEVRRGVVEAGERIGLTVTAGPERTGLAETVRGVRYQLKVGAMDQPGIVHRVTHLLHSLGANVEDLRTQLEAGAHSGTPLFKMDLMMTVPPEVRVKDLRAELERLCDALNCDYELAAGG